MTIICLGWSRGEPDSPQHPGNRNISLESLSLVLTLRKAGEDRNSEERGEREEQSKRWKEMNGLCWNSNGTIPVLLTQAVLTLEVKESVRSPSLQRNFPNTYKPVDQASLLSSSVASFNQMSNTSTDWNPSFSPVLSARRVDGVPKKLRKSRAKTLSSPGTQNVLSPN